MTEPRLKVDFEFNARIELSAQQDECTGDHGEVGLVGLEGSLVRPDALQKHLREVSIGEK